MHSSGMLTSRSLTVFLSIRWGGVCIYGGLPNSPQDADPSPPIPQTSFACGKNIVIDTNVQKNLVVMKTAHNGQFLANISLLLRGPSLLWQEKYAFHAHH